MTTIETPPTCSMPVTPIGSLCETAERVFKVRYRCGDESESRLVIRCGSHLPATVIYLLMDDNDDQLESIVNVPIPAPAPEPKPAPRLS